jgi:hypothetical protein
LQIGSHPEASLQAKEDPTLRDGWTRRYVTFSAVISDPDPNEFVRLRVRIRRPGEPLWTELEGGLVEQGTVYFIFTLPTQGAYDWEYRIEDAEENSIPADVESWLPAFGNSNSPDLRCDLTPPTAPVALYPSDFDVAVGNPAEGDVTFGFTESVDDGPVEGLTHEIEITGTESILSIPVGTGTATVRLPVSSEGRSWRVRARDIAGNVSAWSESLRFRVVYDDRINHAAGDGRTPCLFGSTASPSLGALLWAALAVGAGSILNGRIRRRPARP